MPKRLCNCMQYLDAYNLKFIHLCTKYAMQTSSVEE